MAVLSKSLNVLNIKSGTSQRVSLVLLPCLLYF